MSQSGKQFALSRGKPLAAGRMRDISPDILSGRIKRCHPAKRFSGRAGPLFRHTTIGQSSRVCNPKRELNQVSLPNVIVCAGARSEGRRANGVILFCPVWLTKKRII
jgi:hypothetical protein